MNVLLPGRFGTGWRLAFLVGVGAAQAAASILLIRAVASAVSGAADAGGIGPALALAAAAALGLSVLRLVELWQAEAMAQRIVHGLRARLAGQLLNLPPKGAKAARAEILLRFTGEMAPLRTWHMRAIPSLVVALPVILGGSFYLAMRDLRLGAAAAAVILCTLAVQLALSPAHLRAADAARRARGRLAGEVCARFDTLAAVQAFGRTGQALRAIERRSRRFAEAMVARARRAGLMRAAAEFGATGLLVAIAALALLDPAMQGATLAGGLAFATILGPRLRALGRIPEQFNLALVARRRIDAFMAEPVLDIRGEGPGLAAREGRLVLREVTWAEGQAPFSARAEAGGRVLVRGPSGAGKSRLFGLIAGLEDPVSGRIVLDGRDIGRRRRSDLRKRVAIAGEGMPLIRGTVADNMALGARVSPAERDRILGLCRWDELERRLPRGAMTRVSAGAPELSAGQRAQVALIRALMRRPVVLILDDIDAALDEAGRAALRDVFDGFAGTILFTARDPAIASLAGDTWQLASPEPARKEARNA
ncbi:MAG: hypothetical protein KatS3mg118_2579 [Paracoccaceae bacterium]|nr:MAG: hypothetical protein KatS3mg118_2579 [Paracoccaceae bacterium]